MSDFVKKLYAWCLNKVRFVAGAIIAFLPRVLSNEKKSVAFLKRVFMILAMMLFMCPVIFRVGGGASASGIPDLSNCTATYVVLDDGHGNWRVKFTSSGTWTPTKTITIDVFLVGGGGGGGLSGYWGGNGGGGGRVGTHASIVLVKDTAYSIVVGAGGASGAIGGSTSAFSYTVLGGSAGAESAGSGSGASGGGAGARYSDGSAGIGGSNGSNGASSTSSETRTGGTGDGLTTREFGESSGDLYAGGGGGGAGANGYNSAAGSDGGGHGGDKNTIGSNATANTGSGGGGGGSGNGSNYAGGLGASGICIIRNHREAA